MTIILNGDRVDVTPPLTLSTLLVQLGVDPRRVAIEHNLNVIKKTSYDTTEIHDGDQVEIVNFVGGGTTR
ncbi:MAG TPA: sulfur carrier protein ThiS [Vicinamibacterales bacterium]|jgi:thiamine biosynthesis protein ThiS|nr:sulfur carrier protein ThiS [Vicinamibacterales bacterium]